MMLAQMNLTEQNLVKPELVTIANDSERWEASKQQTGDANTNNPGTDRMAFFNFCYANESNGLILALEKYQASERKTSFPRISTYPSCCAQETKNERVDVGDRYRRGSKQQVQVQKESAANDCTSYPGTVSNNDDEQGPQSLAAHTGSNKCLICRNVDCRGNLYCNMLSPNNNYNELIALNRRKSVVQNRRKSALQMQSGGSAAATLGDESANRCGDGDKFSSILQALYSKSNSPTRRSREDDFQHRCMYSSLEHNNDTNCPDAREKCSCELKSCAQDRTRTNYCNLNILSNLTPARLTTYRLQPKKLVPFMPLTARESKDKESRTCQQYRYCLDGDTSSFRDSVSSSVRELESEPSDASQIGSVSKKSSLPSSPSSFRTTSRRPKSIFRYRPRSSLSSSAPFSLINAILWVIVCTMLMNFTISLVVSGAQSNSTSPASGVCTSIDIRNRAQALNNLTGCRVIEGFLVITLMDSANQTDFENYTFPHLTEITEYLMLYRVSGIRSLAKLFPNLQVIRGNYLFEGFALIIFENANMEEIGLTSLTTIMRGGVRIEKNPVLCFVHTIHWNRIALNATPETLVFKHNKATNECPLCGPGKVKGAGSTYHLPDNKQYCWNQDHYQKICPSECGHRACNSQGKCCNETCLGDCPNDENVCSLCRNLVAYGGKYGEKRCVQECPANSYKHMNRRCLTKEECLRVVKPLRVDTETYPYVPFEGECLLGCKSGYEKVNRTCVPCHNKCTKQCGPKRIFSIRDAEDLRGCTIITGDLMISIRQAGPHLVEDLESALSSIEEIQGYLKITRTYSIVSLSFFRRLRVIRGLTLDESKYALYVLDNQNLQNLWAENQNVTIERGRIFFHFNPKLCYNKIEALKPFISGNKTFDLAEVAPDSNGDRVACDIQELKIKSIETSEQAALVTVVPMGFEDERVFLGYQYYYIEAPHKNVSIYENRHGCGYDSWDVDDDHNKDSVHLFTHLKPYTQYALYVKTYTIASEKKGGQSKIHYFRTLPSTPDPVRNLEYTVLNYSSIEIRWIEPREPKGNLTEYRFQAEITAENPMILEQRNYCKEPIKETIRERIPDEPPKKPVIASEESCRSICKGTEHNLPSKTIEESPVRENEIDFEDAIQNFVYVRRTTPSEQKAENQTRSKRSIETNPVKTLPNTNNQTDAPHEEELRMIKDEHGSWSQYGKNVTANVKSFIFTGLKHYSRYKIYVKACREGTGARCSMEARIYPRTAKKDGADDVQNLTAHIENINNTRNSVRLTWKEPPVPNGLVVSYSIKYYRVDMEHAKHVDKCITYREYNSTKGYILYDMDSGNYSVQVMATSLAGDGTYCKPVFFYIKESRLSWQMITLICVLILTFIIIIGILIWYFRRRCLPPPDDLKLFTSVNPEYISMQYTPDEWEIPREKIIQLRELGQGSFGMVYEGIVENLRNDGVDVSCAIKTVNENATDRERINFLNEASVMKAFDTFHVVRLYGVVSRDQPTLVIMELMTNGDLKGYLRSNRPDAEAAKAGKVTGTPPTLKRILQMAIEIADGMAYLSAKKFVHRDLAARNCMVAEDLTVKIGDFGMTRDIYETDYYRKGTKGLLPVRWMSPESLKDGVFSSSSDVFSYGVVLWEMATLASQPYQGLSNDQVLRYVIDGGVMERPENCPDKLYNLMRRCWQHRPSSRPTFMEIINHLLDDANTNFRTVSFFHTDHGQEIFKQLLAGKRFTDHIDDTTPLRMGDDDFKLDVGENFLMDRTDSHLVPEEPQHSPYSLGSALAINSIPDGTSKRNNDNSSPSSVITSNKKDKDSASTTTATTVQSFSNSLVPPRFRRMWRNAFLGNGNSNYSNRSCNGAGAGGSDTAATVGATTTTATPSVAEAGTSVPVGIEIGAKASVAGSNSGANSGSVISSGISGLLSGLRGRGQNSDGRGGSNSRSTGKDFSSKSGQKVSQETITNPLLSDTSFDEISAIQSTTLNIQPDPHILQSSQNDNKVKNSSLENRNRSTNQIGSSASSPYQKPERQTAQHNQSEEQWMYSNGFVPSSNSSTPLLPQTSSSQLYRDGARPPPKVLDSKRYPDVTSVKEPVTARTSQARLNKNYSQKANYAEQQPEGRNSIARRRSPTSTSS